MRGSYIGNPEHIKQSQSLKFPLLGTINTQITEAQKATGAG